MESVKEIAVIFCAVCVAAGGFQLMSSGALEKSAGYILSLILLTTLITAVSGADIKLDFSGTGEAVSEETVAGAEAISEYQAEYICAKLLEEKGIEYEKISAEATKTEDGSIIINKITIKGADKSSQAAEAVISSGLTDTVEMK